MNNYKKIYISQRNLISHVIPYGKIHTVTNIYFIFYIAYKTWLQKREIFSPSAFENIDSRFECKLDNDAELFLMYI